MLLGVLHITWSYKSWAPGSETVVEVCKPNKPPHACTSQLQKKSTLSKVKWSAPMFSNVFYWSLACNVQCLHRLAAPFSYSQCLQLLLPGIYQPNVFNIGHWSHHEPWCLPTKDTMFSSTCHGIATWIRIDGWRTSFRETCRGKPFRWLASFSRTCRKKWDIWFSIMESSQIWNMSCWEYHGLTYIL